MKLLLLCILSTCASIAISRHTAFNPGQLWRDTQGTVIDAHGAGLLKEGAAYYWYGETRHGEPSSQASCFRNSSHTSVTLSAGFTPGINLYVSDGDLYNWKHVGLVFAANATGSHCLERPKVIRCPATGKYVLWAKGFPQDGSVRAVIATSPSPMGPFTLVNPAQPFYSPDGNRTFADATLYVDPTSTKSYVFFRTREDGLRVAQLTEDCTAIDGQSSFIADKKHEAPAVFQSHENIYVWTSDTTGFGANAAKLLVSKNGSFTGPFEEFGNPTHDAATFDSQSTYILPNPSYVAGSRLAQFVYVADRWQTNTTNFGTYVWLPLFVDRDGVVSVKNETSWRYDSTLDSADTATLV